MDFSFRQGTAKPYISSWNGAVAILKESERWDEEHNEMRSQDSDLKEVQRSWTNALEKS